MFYNKKTKIIKKKLFMNLSITHAGIYTSPEKYQQNTHCVFLGLILSGLEYMKIHAPDGTLLAEAENQSLFLIPPYFFLDFSYHRFRKNYVVLCNIDGLSWNSQTRKTEWDCDGQKLELPLTVPIVPSRIESISDIFQRTVQLNGSALPADAKAAELLMFSILTEFLEHSRRDSEQNIPDFVVQLKNEIDSNTAFDRTLSEIMQTIPVTAIHQRRIFQKYYHTTPQEYRSRLRFSRIRYLLTETEMSFKEIADAVGMNHVTHLFLFLKKQCGMTPSELRKKLKM